MNIPHIAVFKTADSERARFAEVFARHQYDTEVVTSLHELEQLSQDLQGDLDAILLGSSIVDGASGPATCEQIRRLPALATIPVVGLLLTRDVGLARSFVDAGADLVLTPPYDPEILWLQLSALSRLKQLSDHRLLEHRDASGLQVSSMAALNCSREGIVLFDSSRNPVYANRAARQLIGMSQSPDGVERARAQALLAALGQTTLPQPEAGTNLPSALSRKMQRLDGRSFEASLRSLVIYGDTSDVAGFALGISDLAEINHLSNLLLQSQRTRCLALFLASGCLGYIESSYKQIPVAPIGRIQEFLDHSPNQCALNTLLLALTETLDLAIGSDVQLKVEGNADCTIQARFADAFQIAGHMLLYAVEQAGSGGEILLHTEVSPETAEVLLVVSTESRCPAPFLENDPLTHLRGAYYPWNNDPSEAPPLGIANAQRIADRLGKIIQFKHTQTGFKLRVALPLLAQSA